MAAHLPAVLDVLRSLAEEPSLLKQTRVQAPPAHGRLGRGLAELADEGLAADPKNVALRAAKARAQIALRDFDAAERELDMLKGARSVPAVVVARAALAVERGDPVEKRDEALSPLLGRPASEWRVPCLSWPHRHRELLDRRLRRQPWQPHRNSRLRSQAWRPLWRRVPWPAGRGQPGGSAHQGSGSEHGTDQGRGARLDKVGGADPAAAH